MWPTPSWVLTCIHTLNVRQILPVFLSSFSSLSSCPSIHRSNRQQWQWPGALHGAAPARGAGPAAGSDQVHQEGASVSLQRLQERMSVWRLLTVPDSPCKLIIQRSNISFLPWAGVSQWNGGWGDIQDHLFSVLSPRRSEILSSLNSLSFSDLTFQHCSKSKIKKSAFPSCVVGTVNILLSASRVTVTVGLVFS